MRIAVCMDNSTERGQLIKWLGQYCTLYGIPSQPEAFSDEAAFAVAHDASPYSIVFMGFGGTDGFLAARKLRDRDKRCRIVLIDDTAEYAVSGVRLHFSDCMVRPIEFKKVVRAMKLSTEEINGRYQ